MGTYTKVLHTGEEAKYWNVKHMYFNEKLQGWVITSWVLKVNIPRKKLQSNGRKVQVLLVSIHLRKH